MLLFLRASFPRIRYDVILNMYWYSVLPISILALLNYLSLNY
jgi:NADH:ubiquinone oxidoreductase subunit H